MEDSIDNWVADSTVGPATVVDSTVEPTVVGSVVGSTALTCFLLCVGCVGSSHSNVHCFWCGIAIPHVLVGHRSCNGCDCKAFCTRASYVQLVHIDSRSKVVCSLVTGVVAAWWLMLVLLLLLVVA